MQWLAHMANVSAPKIGLTLGDIKVSDAAVAESTAINAHLPDQVMLSVTIKNKL